MKYDELIEKIIACVGGEENIISVEHCATRLRFVLKNINLSNTKFLEECEGIISVIQSGGQYQIVIGSHVHDVYLELLDKYPDLSSKKEEIINNDEKVSLLDKFSDIVTGVFTPILGLLAATGFIKGILSFLTAFSILDINSGTYMILYTIADGFFYSLPIFLGYTTSKKFNGDPFIGMTIGISLIYPTIIQTLNGDPTSTLFVGTLFESNVFGNFFGIPIILINYTTTVIPVIFSTYFAAKIEKKLNNIIPDIVKFFVVPALTLLVTVPLAFLVIGPITTWGGNLIGAIVKSVYEFNTIIAGIVLGSTWQILVVFGLHWAPMPIVMNNLSTMGFDPIAGFVASATFAQIGAVLAAYFKCKNQKIKSMCIPAIGSGLFGITEPAIYGVTLPLKRPFIISCIAAGVGGAIAGLFKTVMYQFGGGGIFEIFSYIDPVNGFTLGCMGWIVSCSIGGVLSFGLTYLFGFKKDEKKGEKLIDDSKKLILYAPVEGKLLPLNKIEDKAFSTGALGKGVAIYPKNNIFVSPVEGTVKMLFPTKHAIGIETKEGVEILIHIGIDTVRLNGECFNALVKTGDQVKVGTPLIQTDLDAIIEKGYDVITPIIITNPQNYSQIKVVDQTNVKMQKAIFEISERGKNCDKIS